MKGESTNGPLTLLDAFEGRRQLIAYYFMWHPGHPAPEQCEGSTTRPVGHNRGRFTAPTRG